MQTLKNVFTSPRFKSFYWRAGGFVVVGFLGATGDSLNLFHLSPAMIAFIGLIINEITKKVNDFVTVESTQTPAQG